MVQGGNENVGGLDTTDRSVRKLLATTIAGWQHDKAGMFGAALAYYAIFSLVPLLVISLAAASGLFGEQAAQGALKHQLQAFIHPEGAKEIEDLMVRAHRPRRSLMAGVAGTAVLLFAASGLFTQLQDALNTIWRVRSGARRGILGTLRARFWSFIVVLVAGLTLSLLVALSTALDTVGHWTGTVAPGLAPFWQFVGAVASWSVGALVFALVFKLLPEARVAWRDVWVGALVTAVLFAAGKYLFGLYLRWVSFDSMYGPAGALIVVLVWAFYSAQIVLFGAEFTHAYSRLYGSGSNVDS